MENELSNIGKRLTEIRKSKNLTQQEVADGIPGLTIQMISSYENDKQKPGIENLIKIAKFFDVSLDYICFRKTKNNTAEKIVNYDDLMRNIIKIMETQLFNVTYNTNRNINNKFIHSINIYADDEILYTFFMNLSKLNDAKDILGLDMYQEALESLISKHKDIKINN
jgi:transcriptional regulator with XRE-family HTH domain